MPLHDPTPPPGSAAPENTEADPLLDINGNPILVHWDAAGVPAPADASPPKPGDAPLARKPGLKHREPRASSSDPDPPPAETALGVGPMRYDLAGNPITSGRATLPTTSPTSRRGGGWANRSSSGSSLGLVIALLVMALIAGLAYCWSLRNQAAPKPPAKPAAAGVHSGASPRAGGSKPARAKHHSAP